MYLMYSLPNLGRFAYIALIVLVYVFLSVYTFRYMRWGCISLQLALLFYFFLHALFRIRLLPISLDFILKIKEREMSSLLCERYTLVFNDLFEALKSLNVSDVTSLKSKDDNATWNTITNLGSFDHQKFKTSLIEAYQIYSALYLLVNTQNYQTSQYLLPTYLEIKKLLSCIETLRLNIKALVAAKPNGTIVKNSSWNNNIPVQLGIFVDKNDNVRAAFEQWDKLAQVTATLESCNGSGISLLSMGARENVGIITRELFNTGNAEIWYNTEMMNLTIESCKRVREAFVQMQDSVNPGFGDISYMRNLGIIRYRAKRFMEIIPHRFPSLHSTLDTMFIPCERLYAQAFAKASRQPLDYKSFDPRNKSVDAIMVMLLGTNAYSILYGKTFFQSSVEDTPLVLFYNPNCLSYEFFFADQNEVDFYTARDRKVLLHNYVGVGESTGKITVDRISDDSFKLAETIYKRFESPNFRIGLHGYSIGGYFATFAAHKMQFRVDPEALDFLVSVKSFGSFLDLAVHHLGGIAKTLLPLIGLNIDAGDYYKALVCKKVAVADLADDIVPMEFGIPSSMAQAISIHKVTDGTNALLEFQKYVNFIMRKTIEPESFHGNGKKRNRNVNRFHNSTDSSLETSDTDDSLDDEDEYDMSVKMATTASLVLNASGHLARHVLTVNPEFFIPSQYKTIQTFLGRMLLYGSLPSRSVYRSNKLDDFSIADIPSLLKRCLIPGVAFCGDGKYLVLPKRIAISLYYLIYESYDIYTKTPAIFKHASSDFMIVDVAAFGMVEKDASNIPNTWSTLSPCTIFFEEIYSLLGIENPKVDVRRFISWMRLYSVLLLTQLKATFIALDPEAASSIATCGIATIDAIVMDVANLPGEVTDNNISCKVSKKEICEKEEIEDPEMQLEFQVAGGLIPTVEGHMMSLGPDELRLLEKYLDLEKTSWIF